ncbi:MAG: LPS export ABC transporter periplasmic protein LptC [Candidatus Binatia bacterium]
MKWYVIVLLGIVIGGISFARAGRLLRPTEPREAVPELWHDDAMQPDMQVQNMHLAVQVGSAIAWQVSAEQAAFSELEQRTVARRVDAKIFPDTTDTWHITAAHGLIDRTTGNVVVKGQVRLHHRAGYTIEMDELRWRAADRILYTEVPVTMRSASASISGTGLRSLVDQYRITVQRDVRAFFRLRGSR